ncbi:lycopene cyclase domain-containing protein [Candidatus Parcubacteria bacterium]|nr:lycopene cyclase domain-containing protein [Candidatus Parcubacteria bacterium]
MGKYYYLLALVWVFVFPSIVAWLVFSPLIPLSALIPFVVSVTIVGIILDVWATRHGRKDRVWLWQFNPKNTLGVKWFGLPVEEYLFYVSGSIYMVLMWEGLQIMISGAPSWVYLTTGVLGAWTLIFTLAVFLIRPKGDRVR